MAQTLMSAPHIAAIVPPFTVVHPRLADADDNRLLEVAIAADAELLITGDKEVLALQSLSRPHVMEPEPLPSTPVLIMSPADAFDYLQSLE